MHEALELLQFDLSAKQLGVLLAVCRRSQGSTVLSIIANLQTSAEAGSTPARNAVFYYQQADEVLQRMADVEKVKHLHSAPRQHNQWTKARV